MLHLSLLPNFCSFPVSPFLVSTYPLVQLSHCSAIKGFVVTSTQFWLMTIPFKFRSTQFSRCLQTPAYLPWAGLHIFVCMRYFNSILCQIAFGWHRLFLSPLQHAPIPIILYLQITLPSCWAISFSCIDRTHTFCRSLLSHKSFVDASPLIFNEMRYAWLNCLSCTSNGHKTHFVRIPLCVCASHLMSKFSKRTNVLSPHRFVLPSAIGDYTTRTHAHTHTHTPWYN